ncbi:phytanoyl-CoA dioxygenase family protein [Rhodoferax sp. AJA081-3]|nr:phytanoyl-CoA dioxygenase family protein [Rhodoferax sp. AJA081-3]
MPNYILRAAHFRSSTGAMPYHIDSFIPYGGDYSSVVQCMLFLNHSTSQNGCTLAVPGSHKSAAYAPQGFNPQAVAIEAEPGDMVVVDSRIWHATLANEANTSRWALIATFCRWYIKQSYDYPRVLSRAVFDGLKDDEKWFWVLLNSATGRI